MIRAFRFPLLLALALGLGACGTRTFETITTLGNGERPLPVSLLDRTGLVLGIAESHEPTATLEDGISGRNGGLVYLWVSGACDEHVFLTLEGADAGYRLVARTEKSQNVCHLIGFTRQILITSAIAIAPDKVVVLEGQP